MADHIVPSRKIDTKALRDRYLELPQPENQIQAEYIWLGGHNELRSKCMTISRLPASPSDLPDWNYDGSSTDQAPGHDSEVYMRPRAIFRDPFRKGQNILVMCDTYRPDGTPLPNNHRWKAAKVIEQAAHEEPWFGIEQEYTLVDPRNGRPLGFPEYGFPRPQGPYYCSVGPTNAIGRDIVEAHYRAALYAGVKIAGCNAEVMPGQWEFQCGICHGMEIGDHLWVARWILQRVAEDFGVEVSFEPKPQVGDWNGAGCHTNYSTKAMREEGGFAKIIEAVEKLKVKHADHMLAYGEGNEKRMTGKHETARYDTFTYGVANRGASVRIPRFTERDGRGYFEDRRPASNMDPYIVCAMLVSTTCDIPL